MNLLLDFPGLPGCLAIMLACAVRGLLVPRDQWRTNWVLLAAAVQCPLQILIVELLRFLSWLRPRKYDLYLYRINAALFGHPSFYLGRLAALHRWFRLLMIFSYSQLVIPMIVAIAAALWLRPKREAMRTLIAFAITFPLAVPLYLLFPVCGPLYAFPGFPAAPLSVDLPHPLALTAAPNGFPSIHMATAILICWYLRHWRWGQFLGAGFMILTALATMATGQHYFIDLVFAFPYAAAMVRLASLYRRTEPLQIAAILQPRRRPDSSRSPEWCN